MIKTSDFSEIRLSSILISIILFLSYWLGSIGLLGVPSFLPLILSISVILLPIVLREFSDLPDAFLQVLTLLFFFLLGWISILLKVDLSAVLYLVFLISVFFFFKKKELKVMDTI